MLILYSKTKRNAKNIFREKNISALFALLALPKIFFFRDQKDRLQTLSSALCHIQNKLFSKLFLSRALLVAKSKDVYPESGQNITLNYSVLLKPYISKNEKGVLLISFERELEKIVNFKMLEIVQSRYHIIFIPSWSGLFSPSLLALVARSQERFYVMPVHKWERSMCIRLGQHCRPLPFNAASWVKKEFYTGYPHRRDIKCLVVANFAEFKRHWILFKALSKLPPDVTAVCVGVPLGKRTADSLWREAKEYGVSERITIIENPTQKNLRNYFQRAKIFCALSYREGSFIAVAEALVSGTPVLMFKNAHIGTKELIDTNQDNGALVNSIPHLREKILYFLSKNNHEKIKKSMHKRVDASYNSNVLNRLLKETALQEGEEWSANIEPIYSMKLDFHYENPESHQRLKNDYNYLRSKHIEIKSFL